MKKNHKVFAILLFGLLSASTSISLFFTNCSTYLSAYGSETKCFWNHYQKLEPTVNDAGYKEYWVCCSHHEIVFEQPQTGTISSTGVHNASFANKLDDSDSRKILSYSAQASALDAKIGNLPNEEDLVFEDVKLFNEIRSCYDNMNESTKTLVNSWNSFKMSETYFKSKYPSLYNAGQDEFANREYLQTAYNLTIKNECSIGDYFSLSNITGSDTMWIYPNKDLSLSTYKKIYFYVRCSESTNIGLRTKYDYSTKQVISLTSNTWTLVSINISDYSLTNLNQIGIAKWKGSAFSYTFDLDISGFYGEIDNQCFAADKLFDASIDSLKYVNYAATYDVNRGYDKIINDDYISLSNMSNTTDALWFAADKALNIAEYSSIYFYFKCSRDINIDIREVHDYVIDQSISIKSNTWTRIVISVNDSTFRDGVLSEIGFDNWGSHTETESGIWYFSSFYGIKDYEVIDGVKVPKYSSDEIIDFTAYATPPGRSIEQARSNFERAKEAGFTKGIGLLDGRSSTYQSAFQDALRNYLNSKTTSNKEVLLTSIDNFCNAIDSNNNGIIEQAYDVGFKYYALSCILYDFRDFAGACTYTVDDYSLVINRILDKSNFITNPKFQGLFYMDEPSVGSNFEYIKTFFEAYQQKTSQEAYINMLPMNNMSEKSTYANYISSYFTNVFKYTNYISFDLYPIMKTGIVDHHLYNLELIANQLKNNGGKDFRTYIYSNKGLNSSTSHSGIDSVEDLSFQIYSNLAFGSSSIGYFVYSSNNDYSLTEADDKTDGLVNCVNYEESELYGYAKQINNEVHSFESAFKHFSWDKVITKGLCTQFNKLETNVSAYGKLTKVSSTKNTLIGCFKDKANNNAYLLTNYQNTNESNISSTVEMTFNNASHVIVYKDGEKHVYELSNGKYSISLDAAHGAFVIPITI